MQLTPDVAKILAGAYTANVEREAKTTAKVLAAVPNQNHDYRPDPKSKTAMELAQHIAVTDVWFLDSVVKGAFSKEQPGGAPAGAVELAAWYDKEITDRLTKIATLSGEDLAKPIQFYIFNLPAVMYLSFMSNHSIHHRGQLSTYLRAMGGKCPAIYGGSADEPFEMPATA
jgi:uncharacterized damage-inducible protein DinB